jgi:hypothetical protein
MTGWPALVSASRGYRKFSKEEKGKNYLEIRKMRELPSFPGDPVEG